jgi:beta-mannosidase
MQTIRWNRIFVALLLLTLAFVGKADSQTVAKTVTDLDRGWEFRQISGDGAEQRSGWMSAKVPGDIHLDLLANKLITDPFYRDNEAKLQWIEKAAWEYRSSFDVTAKQLAHRNLDLVFEGLDTDCQVYVNDKLVLNADNMHRDWRVPVKTNLHTGKNSLRVVFPSPVDAAQKVAAKDPWQSKTGTKEEAYIRKAAYEYGWDWGPRFVTSGIWRPVRLEGWDDVRISNLHIRQLDVTNKVAHLVAEVEVESAVVGTAQVGMAFFDHGKQVTFGRTVQVKAGTNQIDFPIEIDKPNLWYPAGYGAQPLYSFTARVSKNGVTQDELKQKTGLRSVVLRRDLDQWGRSFEFVVNGIPIFAKGADVIPFDSFPSRVTTSDYRRILESARDANMNMVRHWGGGYYESEEFYTICDELGIMVWQDFMFGNGWQPGTYDFKQEIEAEAIDVVRRLRDHPSIVLWSGNNETEEAYNWAVNVKSRTPATRLQMWQDYLTEFSGILPRVVARLDPERPYWPSSPSADYEETSEKYVSGDQHDWSVWHGRVPFSEYEKHHYRFVSEYGFQSFPEMRTIESFTEPEDRTSIFTPVMLAHQKNNEGNSLIQDYIAKDYPAPKDFASFLYVSQVLQAEGIKIGAEHWRRSRPETMGSIFWQLNDCWPVASWASIDSEGRWKALQYYARRFYAPLLVSPHVEDGVVKVYVVSDKTANTDGKLHLRLMDFSGKVLLEETKAIAVSALSSKVYAEWPLAKLAGTDGANDTSRLFVVADLESSGEKASRNLIYLVPTKKVVLPVAVLNGELTGKAGNYQLKIFSPVLARSVYASFGKLDVKFSDNYFDLLPGETRSITVDSARSLEELRQNLSVVSLRDAFGDNTVTADVSAKK